MALKEAWITAAENDAAAQNAIALAKSLRRTLTGKKILVIRGSDVSSNITEVLKKEFDAVLPMDVRMVLGEKNLGVLAFEEVVKVFLHDIQFFKRGIFISPSVLVLRNVDFMFDSLFESPVSQVAWTGDSETRSFDLTSPVFAVMPSHSTFTFLTNRFVSKTSVLLPEFEDLQAKAARLFSYCGLTLPSSSQEINEFMLDQEMSMVKFPVEYSTRILPSDYLQKLGNLGKVLEGVFNQGEPSAEVTARSPQPTVPLERMVDEPIAIIGLACRFPASNDVEEYWTLLMNKGDAITTVPEWRWPEDQVKEVSFDKKEAKGGFLKCPIDEFDAKFFGMSPKEMEFTDPQQRMLLEVSWEALEDAAVDAHSLKGTQTGIFTGTWTRDYTDLMKKVGFEENEFFRSYMGNSYGATAGRMAHFYGVTGSNVATESGCSSSMVAVGLACSSLRRKQATMALACGVNLLIQPFGHDVMAAFCAKDGHCKTFDVAADGFGRAEGCGVLVLKRLSDAVRDGDKIRAVIRGFGEAQEGPSRSLGTPTVDVESLAMSLALKDAEVEPREVSFVEAHGTGTAVGDPMEMEAIAKVYSRGREVPLLVTSVKTNVGHTESCAGIAGIIKTVLSLEREVIPPHRALDTLNPKIDLSKTPAIIPLEATPWPKEPNRRRIAGVSSFGITGTDAHLILQESPDVPPQCAATSSPPFHVLALSARSKVALDELIGKYKETLQKATFEWRDVTFTANTGRAHFGEFRAAVVASDAADFLRQVERQTIQQVQCPPSSQRQKVVFLFTGQGSQYAGMAKELYATSTDFRRTFNRCDKVLREKYAIDIRRALWDSADSELLHQTLYSQASIFVIDVCLAELWRTWGVTPDVVVGHSLGEYAAACVAGMLSLEDALKLVAERSRLVDKLPKGKMIVVQANVSKAQRLLKAAEPDVVLDVAAMNSPEQTTLSGTEASVEKFKTFCTNNGVRSHVLNATHAFHSFMMDPALPQLRKVAQSVEYKRPKCTFVSGMEGRAVLSVDAEYWVQNTRQSVNFVGACEALEGPEGLVCVEVGAQPILSTFVAANLEGKQTSLALLPSLRRNQSDWRTLMGSVAKLYTMGVDVNWSRLYRLVEASKVSGLPTYPFQRKKFWFEKPKTDGLLFSGKQLHPLVNFLLPNASPTKIFQSRLSLESAAYVKDHVVGRHVIFPGAGYVEMVLAAGHCATLAEFEDFRLPKQPIFLRDLIVEAPLGFKEKEEVYVQTIVAPPDASVSAEDSNWTSVAIHRQQIDESGTKSWVRHASAKFSSFWNEVSGLEFPETLNVEPKQKSLRSVEMESFYEQLKSVGLNFGDTFCSLKRLWKGETETLAEVASPPGVSFFCHPVAIDAIIQTLMASRDDQLHQMVVPVKIDHFVWFGSANESTKFFVLVNTNGQTKSAVLYDDSGKRLAVMSGVELVPTTAGAIENALQAQKLVLPQLLEEEWVPSNVPFVSEDVSGLKLCLSEVYEKLAEYEGNQMQLINREKVEIQLLYEMSALQGLQAFLEMGWVAKLGEVVKVKEFVREMKATGHLHLMVRRMFEILSHYTDYVEGGDSTFKVTKQLPSIAQLEKRISEIDHSIKHFRVEVDCVRSVAVKTAGVLHGTDSVLPILFGDGNVAENVYTLFKSMVAEGKLLVRAVETVTDELKKNKTEGKSSLRILEVGAGTGGSTRNILPILEKSVVDFSYKFTDISAGFFSKAQAAFAEWTHKMTFSVLDIEKDPKTQGFVHEDYDIIIATHVLHATRSMKETMSNVRHLLRPHGFVLIVEIFEPNPVIDLIFGLVDGYWRFEDFDLRPHHCIVPKSSWSTLLSSTGFVSPRLLKSPVTNSGLIVAQASASPPAYSLPVSQTLDTWLLEGGSLNSEVATKLGKLGRRVVNLGEDPASWKSKLESGRVEGVLFVVDGRNFDATDPTKKFLRLLQTLMSAASSVTPKLVVVTTGSIVLGDQSTAHPHGGTLWGMSRSFRSENPNYFCVNVDLDPHDSPKNNASRLVRLLWTVKEDFIALRDTKSFTARLKRLKLKNKALQLPSNSMRFGLIFPKTNAITDLQFGATPRREVTGNSVEVQVKAAGLNFRDIFCVLKPSNDFEQNESVGCDMAGLVTAVGPGSRNLKVGDEVIGCFFHFGGLPSHIVVPEEHVVRLPKNLSFADGATLPVVFITAFHSLVDVAKLQKGETVLIHTASGGVGLAAIQVARDVGAKIIATAGSRRKRAYLSEVVGIENVFHSRDLSYGDEVRRVTGGRGVDVVLNSLTGPGFKEATLDVCARKGRFIEMSKLNVWSESDVRSLRPDVNYKIVDLTRMSGDPWKVLLSHLDNFLTQGKLRPLPYEAFESVEIREALTHMQKARHIGKVVCSHANEDLKATGSAEASGKRRHQLFNDRSSYLITGGLGGIGLEAAKWMASEGAKFIVLFGRRPPTDKAAAVISELNANGKTVVAVQGDVGKWEDCKKLVDNINGGGLSVNGESFPPLRGIQHAAGCLSDGTIPNQTWAKYEETFNGKVKGAWHLHQLTKCAEFPLEHFVMYSSVAAMFGSMGQSNHAAGNAFLDSLAHFRNAIGLPATSINWGQWGQVGVAADMELSGFTPFTPLQAFASLKEILKRHKKQVTVVLADFAKLRFGYPWLSRGYAKEIIETASSVSSDKTIEKLTSEKFWEEVDAAKGEPKETQLVLQRLLVLIVSQILKTDDSETLDVHQNFQDMGLDSLMMVELKNVLQGALGSKVTLTSSILSDAKSIHHLAKTLREMVQGIEDEELTAEERNEFILAQATLPDEVAAKEDFHLPDLQRNVTCLVTETLDSQFAVHVLFSLTKRPNVRKVYVPSSVEQKNSTLTLIKGEDLEVDLSKVEFIVVDENVNEEFGMSHAEYERLASEVDVVIDCRLRTSRKEGLSSIKTVAKETRQLVEFACQTKLKFVCHVTRLLPQRRAADQSVLEESFPSRSEDDLQRYVDRGYSAAQFVSECLLGESVKRGVPCRVFRLPHLSGDSRTGRFQLEDGHIFVRFLEFLQAGRMPTVPIPFAVVPVNQCAALILDVLLDTPTNSHCVFNLTNPHNYSYKDFFEISEELGRPLRAMELEEFMADKNSIMKSVTYAFGDPLDHKNENYTNLSKLAAGELIPFDNLRKVVENLNERVETPLGIFRKDLRFAQDSGMFQNFVEPGNVENN